MSAQDLFDQGLGHLLAAFGELLPPLRCERERAGESRDLVAEQARAEDDVLRVCHRKGRDRAQRPGEAEPPQVFHGANAGRLGPRPQRIRLQPRLDEQDREAAAAELDGGDEATGAAADNQHIDVAADARHGRSVAATIGVRSVPSRSTSTSTTSPGVRYQGGLRT